MSLQSRISTWWKAMFRAGDVNRQGSEELQFHIDAQAEDLMQRGVSREEALRRARAQLGSVAAVRENARAAWGTRWLDELAGDLRYAVRVVRKSPGFALVAMGTLALAIGANAIVFSILNALVLRPVNVPNGASLYQIEQKDHIPSQSYPDYVDLRDRNRSFDGLALYQIGKAGLATGGAPAPAWIYDTSSNYFDVLRVKPFLGRFFHQEDERGYGSMPYVVLSYAYWQNHFDSDRGVVGRTVRVNNASYTVLGVAQRGFRGTELFFAPDFWEPIVNAESKDFLYGRGNRGAWLVGHLKPGVTVGQATADLNGVAAQLAKAYPNEDSGLTLGLTKPGLVGNMLGGPARAFIAGLMLLSALILLAACANLGSLFAARTADRWREVSVRLALGSTRGRVLRQMLTEALVISVGGAAVGIAAAVLLLRWLSVWQPIPDLPISVPVNPDWRTYAVALGLALLSALMFGLVPTRQVMRANLYQGIKAARNGADGMRRFTARDALLALQVAICAVLVTASLVAVRGMVRSLHSDFGFNPNNAMQVNTDVQMSGYKGDAARAMQRRILDAIQQTPGVTAAGFADRIPLNIGWSDSYVYADSATSFKPSDRIADAMQYSVSPGYFAAAATPLREGRDVTWNDDLKSPRVAVVNEEFARKLFGSEQNAIGKHFKIDAGMRVEVIGVVADGKYETLSEAPQPAMFLSFLQSPSGDTWYIARTNRALDELGPALDRTLNGLNTGLPFVIVTWDRALGTALFAARAASLALGVLGGMGAMLAITGIFGLGAYTVSKRLRELGIRMALGAQRRQVLQSALGRVVRLLAIGSAVGLALGLAATKLLGYIVYQASPRDPVVMVGVVAAMALVGLVATWIPAMRALRADPVLLLREE
jgi:predicted permease